MELKAKKSIWIHKECSGQLYETTNPNILMCGTCASFSLYQPERSKREDSIPEYGAEAPLNYDAWQKRLRDRDAVL
jgi:hypothetical protein